MFENLKKNVNAHYDAQIDAFTHDLNTKTVSEILGSWYYKEYATDAAWKELQTSVNGLIPEKAYKKIVAKYARIQNKYRAEKLDKIASVEAWKAEGHQIDFIIDVEWTRNRTWGSNPTAEVRGGDYATGKASGCGYDKESSAISYALNEFKPALYCMYEFIENGGVLDYGVRVSAGLPYFEYGVGVECFRRNFEKAGYKWHDRGHGKMFDGYGVSAQ